MKRAAIFCIAAETMTALREREQKLLLHLQNNAKSDINDLAFYINSTEPKQGYRRVYIAHNISELIKKIQQNNHQNNIFLASDYLLQPKDVIYMLTGQGFDFPNMGVSLYQSEEVFRQAMDRCSKIIKEIIGFDIINSYYFNDQSVHDLPWEDRIVTSLCAIFAVEYSLLQLLLRRGLSAKTMIAYSMGEVVAGVLAGGISLEDGIRFIVQTGIGARNITDGSFLVINVRASDWKKYQKTGVYLAAILDKNTLLVGGHISKISLLEALLKAEDITYKRLNILCAYHTPHAASIMKHLAPYSEEMMKHVITPYFASTVGGLLKSHVFCDNRYWTNLFGTPMDLEACFKKANSAYPDAVYIEIGPGKTMSTFCKNNIHDEVPVVSTLVSSEKSNSIEQIVAVCCAHGAEINWQKYFDINSSNIQKSPLDNYVVTLAQQAVNHINNEAKVTVKEEKVISIFSQVLSIDSYRISTDDDFYKHLCGDSLQAIYCVKKLNEHGFMISIKDFNQDPTAKSLALFEHMDRQNQCVEINRSKAEVDNIELTPLQIRFFNKSRHWKEQKLTPVKLKLLRNIDIERLRLACETVVNENAALNLSFVNKDGCWYQKFRRYTQVDFNIYEIPMSADPEAFVNDMTNCLISQFSLNEGPLIKFAVFVKENMSVYFVFGCHHLCVDSVSLFLILKRLSVLISEEKSNQQNIIPASFLEWTQYLYTLIDRIDTRKEVDYWRRQTSGYQSIPVDFGDPKNILASDTVEHVIDLDQQLTNLILKKLPLVQNGISMNEVLLYCLSKAVSQQFRVTTLCYDIRRHGRDEQHSHLDLSNTVGWFTVVHPFKVLCETRLTLYEQLERIALDLKDVPNNGINYGVLRYLHRDTSVKQIMNNLSGSQMAFNYHGVLDTIQKEIYPFELMHYIVANNTSTKATRSHLLNFDSMVLNNQLKLVISYSKAHFSLKTIKNVATIFMTLMSSIGKLILDAEIDNLSL